MNLFLEFRFNIETQHIYFSFVFFFWDHPEVD